MRSLRSLALAAASMLLLGATAGCAPSSQSQAVRAITAWNLWAICAPSENSLVRTTRVLFDAGEARSWCTAGANLPASVPAASALLAFREPSGLSALAPRIDRLLFDPSSRAFTLELTPATPSAPATGTTAEEHYVVVLVELARRLVPIGAAVIDNGMTTG
ncbi:hypothetical protein SAMN05892883_0620 [Jatrophihabitans sp. GAS493]|uniref:hypothetical protein n=1 Tax=Jatrophihabitans sp. GAS493 TaxID=1907575 RepID=UPI000BB96043|nr:hypothetical protein [Jatrophihabitans sp. GAS493]SOD71014.1 hypothetical protein SAMN05892883_0620 [Jatrophihabitans sp. GAS493]